MNTTTEIEQLLDAYDVQKSISLKSLADQIIEKYPPSNLSFSTLNLPVKLHIGEMEYLTFIDTNQTIYTFLQDISNYYDLPSTLHIGIPFLLDCIYHSRKFSSFILFPHQDIYIVHQDPTITLNPSPKQHIPSTFPWSKFSKIFSPLLLSSSDANVQVFRIISSLPLSEFTFTDISQPVELLASNFQVLLPPQQITVCSQDQALSLIQLSLKLNKKAKFFSLFSALKLCILYKATLSLPFLERIKNEVKGEPEERNMCIYLGVLSSPSLRSPLTKLTNHVFPQLLHYARDEILMVEPEDIPEVIEGIAEYITKPPKDKTTLIDLFTTPFSYSQSSDAPFSENPMAYAPLLLLDKLVSTYGFCVVTPDLGKILMAFAFPQWRNIYPTSIPLGGPQTINIACKMIAKAPNTRKVFAQYFMETSNIQLNAPKIELSSFPVVQAPNDDDIHFILLTLHLISDAGLYTYANILNSLYSYPCRCVDATFLANKLGGYKSSPRVFKEFLSKEKISIDYYSTSNNITPEKLISVLKGNTYQYVLCEFISTQQFDVQSNTISESYDIIAVVLSNGEYLLHKNKAWFIITKTFLRQLSQREEKRFLSKHIQYIIIKTSKNNNSNFPNNEPSTVSVADVALRSSPYAIDCFELQTTLELFPNLISRYIKFSTSIMFRTILQRLNEFNDPKSVITSLSSKKIY
ncbi:Ubiquitin-like domain-containing protein [Entamoeba marina]